MRLSESLRRNIIRVSVSGILNRFKARSRRSVLFFEDILANYVKECEDTGHGKEMKKMAQKWGYLGTQQLMPSSLKMLPVPIFLNMFFRKAWINIGLVNDLHVTKKSDVIMIESKNESITRIIGRNNFSIGCYLGILSALFESKLDCIEVSQNKKLSKYIFEIKNKSFIINSKNKDEYNKLNTLPEIEGFTLKNALKTKLFRLKKNKIYYKGKPLIPVENTIFHLVGRRNIFLEKIQRISYDFFKNVIKGGKPVNKLKMLRTLLQVMGWGIVKIIIKNKTIIIEIKNPPYGLQIEEDNWDFLVRVILGYLWLLNKDLKILKVDKSYKFLKVMYSSKSS